CASAIPPRAPALPPPTGHSRPSRIAPRECRLLVGDEFEQAGPALLGLAPCPNDRISDLRWILHPLAPATEIAREVGVAPAEVARPVPLMRQLHVRYLDRHRRVVQH